MPPGPVFFLPRPDPEPGSLLVGVVVREGAFSRVGVALGFGVTGAALGPGAASALGLAGVAALSLAAPAASPGSAAFAPVVVGSDGVVVSIALLAAALAFAFAFAFDPGEGLLVPEREGPWFIDHRPTPATPPITSAPTTIAVEPTMRRFRFEASAE